VREMLLRIDMTECLLESSMLFQDLHSPKKFK
jgi:hypothetical protein